MVFFCWFFCAERMLLLLLQRAAAIGAFRLCALQYAQLRIDDVPVEVGAHNVPYILLGVIVPGATVQQSNIIESQNVAGFRFKCKSVAARQTHKLGIGLVPGYDGVQRHGEMTIALGNAVIYTRVISVTV